MFNLIPEDWGGYVTTWVEEIVRSFGRMKALHFRRMIVKDSDLELLATSAAGKVLEVLKLDKCCGFSTDGLRIVGLLCRAHNGTKSNELQFCYESGDPQVQTSEAMEGVFVNSGDNPFELIKDSIKILANHKGTFSHLDTKKIPAHLDWFGWCTWDSFYTEVSPDGIKEGLQSFKEGGISPKFLIIDDGWQETVNEFMKEGEPLIEGAQFATRLVDIKENSKFLGKLLLLILGMI